MIFSKFGRLEKQLKTANAREEKACAELSKKHKGGEWEEYKAASEEVLCCERTLAAAKKEEYAERIKFPVKWDTGAPLPHLFMSDYKAYLTFYVDEPDPNWDGTYVNVVDPKSKKTVSLALVEFKHCRIAKLGSPNDEALHGHRLEGKGLEGYKPLIVKNSKWISEIKNINKVHSHYKEEGWKIYNHYFFGFHDTTFECIAESFNVELFDKSMTELLEIVTSKLLE